MVSSKNAHLLPASGAALAWMATAATAAYWVLQWLSTSTSTLDVGTEAQQPAAPLSTPGLARALGAAAPAQPSPTQAMLELRGIAATASGRGAALIGVNNQAPRAFGVGQHVTPELLLQSLTSRTALLGHELHGPVVQVLELPSPR